mmetsp:Transcript_1259/g.1300  ORF Transcript_1259/g.1300 Transcript_1259/m.1300 type:complete len:173 (-) Transcript_1259:55-573(-)
MSRVKKQVLDDQGAPAGEIGSLWNFVQKFADEHAIDKILELQMEEKTIKEKIDILGWTARYLDFISLTNITQIIMSFKEILIPGNNFNQRQEYFLSKHGSQSVATVLKLLEPLRTLRKDLMQEESENSHRLAILLTILDPLIINDDNLAMGNEGNISQILVDFVCFTEEDLL